MFIECSNINFVYALFTTTPGMEYTRSWLSGVSASGTFIKSSDATWTTQGNHGIPTGWTTINSDQLVDLGLSVKWARCNLGTTTPEGYGIYYQWGDNQGYSHDVGDGKTMDWTAYLWYDKLEDAVTKYNHTDNKVTLDIENDAAYASLGGSWRMPTDVEWDELRNTDNCSWTWTTLNGINGYKVQSKKPGYIGNWLFLPAAGVRSNDDIFSLGNKGFYWSSSLSLDIFRSYVVSFDSNGVNRSVFDRPRGQSIRPVLE